MEAWQDSFFRSRRVAVLAIPRVGKAPLTTPVWYDFDGHRFRIQVEAGSAKAKVLSRAEETEVSLTVQSEVPPYRYAVVYGPARMKPCDDPGLRKKLAHRYFGKIAGDMYVQQEEQRGTGTDSLRVIDIEPKRIVAHDFHPEAGAFGRFYFALYRWWKPVPA